MTWAKLEEAVAKLQDHADRAVWFEISDESAGELAADIRAALERLDATALDHAAACDRELALRQRVAELEREKAREIECANRRMIAEGDQKIALLERVSELERLEVTDVAGWAERAEAAEAKLARCVEVAKSSPLVSYTPVDGEAIRVVPVSVVLAAAKGE